MKTMRQMMVLAAICALPVLAAVAAEKPATPATTVVRSKMIEAVFYDYSNRTMTIFFRKGGTYEYLDVPTRVYEDMIRAPSVGRYYHASVRGHFTSRRLDSGECAAFVDAHEPEARW